MGVKRRAAVVDPDYPVAHSFWDERKVYEIARDDTLMVSTEPGSDIINAITDGLGLNEADTPAHTQFTVHPSSITHCLRRVILERHYGRKPMPTNVLLQAAMGNVLHDRTQTAMQIAGLDIRNEVRMEDQENGTTMRVDGVGYRKGKDGQREPYYVLEIKSVGGWGLKRIKDSGLPRASDIIQIQYYLHVNKLKIGVLLYISRDTGEFHTITLKSDPILQDYIIQRIQAIRTADKTHEVIERPYPVSHWACKPAYCEMSKVCNALDDNDGPMTCGSYIPPPALND